MPPPSVTIRRVGAEGDGIADGPLYLPYTLPGETVRLATDGQRGAAEIVTASPDRVAPSCPHFTACGGCSLQHWSDAPYAAWKAGLLAAALRRAGFPDPALGPLDRTPPGARRRVDLAVRRNGAVLVVGLHAARSAEVVDLAACTVMHPALFALIAPLRTVLRGLAGLRREGSAVLNLLDAGPDLLLRLDGAVNATDRTRLAAFADAHGLPRITVAEGKRAPETACLLRPPAIAFSGVTVAPPAGGFLQASREGEAAIVGAVLAGLPEKLPKSARIAELYAGCGTLTFALAGRGRVDAFEGDAAAHAALRAAANGAGLAGRVTAHARDLARQPLSARELAPFAAVVLDPPHAGAAAQLPAIAAAGLKRVVYVSCNPASLARDAAVLAGAGYRLLRAVPVDQFLWSPRLESVCVFGR